MHTEEREAFDESVLEQIGTDIEKLEAALGTIAKGQDYIIEKKEKNSDTLDNDTFHRFDNISTIANSRGKIKTNFKTKIPLPIRKLMKARRKLILASHESD